MTTSRDLMAEYEQRRARWVRVLWADFWLRLAVIGWRIGRVVALGVMLWR